MQLAANPTAFELFDRADTLDAPLGIVTADCTGAHEYDDGIFVEEVNAGFEAYRVTVCAANTSSLFRNHDIRRRVLDRTESLYLDIDTPTESYKPMLPGDKIENLHFAQGKNRSAIFISFLVGRDIPPDSTEVGVRDVITDRNFVYSTFGEKARYSHNGVAYGKAAALILHHLRPGAGSIEEVYESLIHVPGGAKFRRGSSINQAFMVAANYLAGPVLERAGYPVINRVHNPSNPKYPELLDPTLAHYSLTPGPHEDLGLSRYARFTSPLRRLEDFAMAVVINAYHSGRELSDEEMLFITRAVKRLNLRIAKHSYENKITLNDRGISDSWGIPAREERIEKALAG